MAPKRRKKLARPRRARSGFRLLRALPAEQLDVLAQKLRQVLVIVLRLLLPRLLARVLQPLRLAEVLERARVVLQEVSHRAGDEQQLLALARARLVGEQPLGDGERLAPRLVGLGLLLVRFVVVAEYAVEAAPEVVVAPEHLIDLLGGEQTLRRGD